MPLIERDVPDVRAFQVRQRPLSVTPRQSIVQESRTIASSLLQRFDPNQRKMPVWLGRMVASHLLEDRGKSLLLCLGDRSRNQALHRFVIRVHAGRQPERNALEAK